MTKPKPKPKPILEMNKQPEEEFVKEITVHELHALRKANKEFQLIDVREPYEHKVANIGGELIPLGKIYFNLAEIEKNKKVIIYCRSGRRSAEAVQLLQKATGHAQLYNLKGGILAWAAEIGQAAYVKVLVHSKCL